MNSTAAGWQALQKRARKVQLESFQHGDAHDFLRGLYPTTLPYYSTLNPVFLAGCATTRPLLRADQWLVRDGALPLQDFFARNPSPGGFEGQLLVHEAIAGVVPRPWLRSVALYRVVSNPLPQIRQKPTTTKLLLCGLSSPVYSSLAPPREFLAQVERSLKSALRGVTEVSYFFPRQLLAWEIEGAASLDWVTPVLRLCKNQGHRVRRITREEFHDGNSSLSDWRVLEFNEKLLVADSFILHSFLRRGAIQREASRVRRSATRYVPLSPFHGVEISPARSVSDERFVGRIAALATVETRQLYPWSEPR